MLNFGEMLRSNSNPPAVQQHYAHVDKKKKNRNNKGRANKSSSSSDDEAGEAESEVFLKGYQVVQVEAYKPPEPKPTEEQQYTVLLCASGNNKSNNKEYDQDYDEIPDKTTNNQADSTGNVLTATKSMDSIATADSIYDVPSSVPRDVQTSNE